MPDGIYIHIPFCASHCHYCAFYSEVVQEECFDQYVEVLQKEMEEYRDSMVGTSVTTVYLGGGTPSLLGPGRIMRVLEGLHENFSINPACEITLEANPGDLTTATLSQYKAMGVNRLSIGVQSFNDALLKQIGRRHTSAEAKQAINSAKRAGFDNISMDLIYGLPGQTSEMFRRSLHQAVHLPISHISIYGLSIEEGTYFHRLYRESRLSLPSEEEEWKMYLDMCRVPVHYGFERYEISNFARHGKRSLHNSKYWQYSEFLGLGAGATSFHGNKRKSNLPNWSLYIRSLQNSTEDYYVIEKLNRKVQIEEYTFMHLRLKDGVNIKSFEERFQKSFLYYYEAAVKKLQAARLLTVNGDRVYLTKKGAALANRVFEEFIFTEKSNS